MANPLFDQLGGNQPTRQPDDGGFGAMLARFYQFRQQFQGDPRAEINKLLQSGRITQAQLDADGVAIKAYDKTADNGLGSSDGYEGWYNVDNAKAELNQAVEELKAEGLEISAENPIHLDLPYPSGAEVYSNKANVFKKSVEEALGGLVEIDLVDCKDQTTWLYTGYYTSYGYENNYDLFDLSGWGPDYGDPKSYLDTFLQDYAGHVTKSLGIY